MRVNDRRGARPFREFAASRAGFTVPEIAIVAFVLAAIALVIVPTQVSDRMVEQEDRAVQFLRSLSDAQDAFFKNSENETYGFLSELIGTEPRRDRFLDMAPPLVVSDARWDVDLLVFGGYCYVVYLADEERRPLKRAQDRTDDAACPAAWVAYAWPLEYGETGRQVYAANQSGTVWEFQNARGSFSGPLKIPPAGMIASVVPSEDFPFRPPSKALKSLRWQRVRLRP